MSKIIKQIKFKNLSDFKRRIARLFQDQKEDEEYEFIFPDKETEDAFDKLFSSFKKYEIPE